MRHRDHLTLLLAAVAGCQGPSVAKTAGPGEVGRQVMEAIAAGLGEDPSELRILTGSWDRVADPDLAAEIKAYAMATRTAITCPGGDPHYCWTGGRSWEEAHWIDPSNPRTMPQVLNFEDPWVGTIWFAYRWRRDDGTLRDEAPLYELDVERLENGEWRIGELREIGPSSW